MYLDVHTFYLIVMKKTSFFTRASRNEPLMWYQDDYLLTYVNAELLRILFAALLYSFKQRHCIFKQLLSTPLYTAQRTEAPKLSHHDEVAVHRERAFGCVLLDVFGTKINFCSWLMAYVRYFYSRGKESHRDIHSLVLLRL